jgi:hypothetical protein
MDTTVEEIVKPEGLEGLEALDTLPVFNLFWLGGFVAFVVLALVLTSLSSEPTLEEEEGSVTGWVRRQIGKILLSLNMKEGGVYFNYPFQKGFVEKLFENLPIPQI